MSGLPGIRGNSPQPQNAINSPDLAEMVARVEMLMRHPDATTAGQIERLARGSSQRDRDELSEQLENLIGRLPGGSCNSQLRRRLQKVVDGLREGSRPKTRAPSGTKTSRYNRVPGNTEPADGRALSLSRLSAAEQKTFGRIKATLAEVGVPSLALRTLAPGAAFRKGFAIDAAIHKMTMGKDLMQLLGRLGNQHAKRALGANGLRALKESTARAFYGQVKHQTLQRLLGARQDLLRWGNNGLSRHWARLKSPAARLRFCRDIGLERKLAQKLASEPSAPRGLRSQVDKARQIVDRAIAATSALSVHDPKDCLMLSKVGANVKCDLLMASKARNNSVLAEALKHVAARAHDENTSREGTLEVAETALTLLGAALPFGSALSVALRSLNEAAKIDRAAQARDIGRAGRIGRAGTSDADVAQGTEKALKRAVIDGAVAVGLNIGGSVAGGLLKNPPLGKAAEGAWSAASGLVTAQGLKGDRPLGLTQTPE